MLTTIFVDAHATSATHNGATWNTAYTDLQQALTAANSGDTIKVADGTYKPGSGSTSSSSTFALKNGVTVQGGYAGFGATDPNARDIAANKTILSGFLATTSVSFFAAHVVTGSGTNSTAVLDGFTITQGFGGTTMDGAGMFNSAGSPTVSNCTFFQNKAANGAAMDNIAGSSPTITNCTFDDNSGASTGNGGAMMISSSSPTIQNCQFFDNSTAQSGSSSTNSFGGAIYITGASAPTIRATTFSRNVASIGGGLYSNSTLSPLVTGCTFNQNYAITSNISAAGGAARVLPRLLSSSSDVNSCRMGT